MTNISFISPLSGSPSSKTNLITTSRSEADKGALSNSSKLAGTILQSSLPLHKPGAYQFSASHLNASKRESCESKTAENDGDDQLSEMEKGLTDWCKEAEGTFEYNGRENAAKEILKSYTQNSTSLDLSNNSITSLPPEIWRLTALQELDLSHNKLATIPPEIGQLTALQKLCLCANRLSLLPSEIGKLIALQTLDLSENCLNLLPSEIRKLTALRELNLSYNQLTSLPSEIQYLKALQKLNLSKNWIALLPTEIENLTALEELKINYNQLTSLPPEIEKLTALQTLLLRGNRLISLPPQIEKLIALKTLDLSYNQLTSLPPEIGMLKALQRLYLNRNELTFLPRQIGKLTALEELNCEKNRITSLPSEIGNLKSLKILDAWDNEISSLPLEIGKLKALQTLNLSYNKFTSLPPVIWKLTTLKELIFQSNYVTTIPPEISKLKALTVLDGWDNDITSIPSEIGNLTALRRLCLNENPLLHLPTEVLKLPNSCTVDITGCSFSRSVLEKIQNTVNAQNYSGPRISHSIEESTIAAEILPTPELLKILTKLTGKNPDLSELLESDHADSLKAWLNTIWNIAHDKLHKQGEVEFMTSIMDYLELAEKNKNFRNSLFSIIENALSTSRDKIELSMIHIEMAKQLAEVFYSDLKKLSEYLINVVWVVDQLETLAQDKIATHPLFDPIDIYHGYLIRLKSEFSLPLDLRKTLYYRPNLLTTDDLKIAIKSVKSNLNSIDKRCEFLATQGLWKTALKIKYPKDYEKAIHSKNNPIAALADLTKEVIKGKKPTAVQRKRKFEVYSEEKKD